VEGQKNQGLRKRSVQLGPLLQETKAWRRGPMNPHPKETTEEYNQEGRGSWGGEACPEVRLTPEK